MSKEIVRCLNCGEDVSIKRNGRTHRGKNPLKYCSVDCSTKHYRKKLQEESLGKRTRAKEVYDDYPVNPCRACGKDIKIIRNITSKTMYRSNYVKLKFCSEKCRSVGRSDTGKYSLPYKDQHKNSLIEVSQRPLVVESITSNHILYATPEEVIKLVNGVLNGSIKMRNWS